MIDSKIKSVKDDIQEAEKYKNEAKKLFLEAESLIKSVEREKKKIIEDAREALTKKIELENIELQEEIARQRKSSEIQINLLNKKYLDNITTEITSKISQEVLNQLEGNYNNSQTLEKILKATLENSINK